MFYGEQTGYIPILSPPVAANPICAAPSLVPTRAVNEPSRKLVPINHNHQTIWLQQRSLMCPVSYDFYGQAS